MALPPPPKGLRVIGRRFWNQSNGERIFSEAHELASLEMLCKLWDEIGEDEKTIKVEGRFVTNRFGEKKEHPAVKAIRENRVLACRIIRELGLALVDPDDSNRPPRQYT